MPQPRRRPLVAAAALALALGVSACSSSPAPEASAAGTQTITHAMGSSEVPTHPQRIVALDQSFVDAALVLGGHVVGYTEYHSITSGLPDYLGDAASTYAKDAVGVGKLEQPNLEKIAALKPDVILTAKVRHEQLNDQLKAIAPTVMSETTGPTWKENTLLVGKVLGKEAQARAKIAAYEAQAKKVGAAVTAKVGHAPTVSIVRFREKGVRLYQKKSLSGIVLADAGLKRPASQDVDDFALEISQEKIPLADAEQIYATRVDDDEKKAGTATANAFQANPLWKPLAPKVTTVSDRTWMTAVGLYGAHAILSDIAKANGVPGPDRSFL